MNQTTLHEIKCQYYDRLTSFKMFDNMIPSYMHAGIVEYITIGTQPGGFLTAVLQNNLERAVDRADDTNVKALATYVSFLYNVAPMDCWGSPERVEYWIANGGLSGLNKVPMSIMPAEEEI